MSEERKIKQLRAKVAKRANVTSDIQPRALEPAWNYFITAMIGEGIRDRTRDDYSITWRYFTGWLDEDNYFNMVSLIKEDPSKMKDPPKCYYSMRRA
ncbi:hypothetical protein ACFQ9Y_00360 [Peribacillus simplex]|uniref:hypothetical protein n=1 Tax=Peribacillus simplex TaxID=1478 RepID=UPI00366A8E55